MEGWIKLHRKFISWEWFTNPHTMTLFVYLLLSANRQPKKWKGVDIQTGELVTSIRKLASKTGLSERHTRTSLNNLKTTHEIAIKTTHNYSIITICKYADYQSIENQNDTENDTQKVSKTTHERHSKRQQTRRENQEKKEERINNSRAIKNRLIKTIL